MKNKAYRVICALLSCLIVVASSISSFAAVEDYIDKFAANNIMFYDPDACDDYNKNPGSCGGDITATSVKERLMEVVEKYGELAMDLQREYGVPWELVFAQMVQESGVGSNTSEGSISAGVAANGNFNWLGMMFSDNHFYNTDTPYVSNSGRKWSQYTSIGNMIGGYAIDYMRNGIYDDAFQYTDPNNFNMEQFFYSIIQHYCPPSDGCDADGYWSAVSWSLDIIHEVAKEKGWPTSAELQKKENIAIGGKYPVSGNIHKQIDASPHSLNVDCSNTGNGNSGGTANASISGSNAKEYVWSGLLSVGFTKEQAAGIMGNMQTESGFNPARHQETHYDSTWNNGSFALDSNAGISYGLGLIQWSYERRIDMYNYVKEKAPDLIDYFLKPEKYSHNMNGDAFIKAAGEDIAKKMTAIEIDYLYKELKENSSYSGIFNKNTVDDAADYFFTNVEAPGNDTDSERREQAQAIYEELKDKAFTGGKTIPDECCDPQQTNTSGVYPGKKYDLSDAQLRGIMAMIKGENGSSLEEVQTEATLMANVFEYKKKKSPSIYTESEDADGLVHYLRRKPGSESGWFATYDDYNENYSEYTEEEFAAIKKIFNDGQRTMPAEIVEHDCIVGGGCTAGITSAENDGTSFSPSDYSQYKRGTTKLTSNLGATYIFWKFADDSTKSGDPFGYYEDNVPSDSGSQSGGVSSASSSSVTWEDGWITGGIDGFTKNSALSGYVAGDDAHLGNYKTNTPKGEQGANKILLHNTEGPHDGDCMPLDCVYGSNSFPPHFTIDLPNKKLYQHFPITKPSDAIKSHDADAGVQIEIIGYSTEKDAGSDWYLFNEEKFTKTEWLYLAQLLLAISNETGIPLTSGNIIDWENREDARITTSQFHEYEGILAHMHAPDNDHIDTGNIWPMVSEAINSLGSVMSTCKDNSISDFVWMGQCDEKWGSSPFGSCGTVCDSGCGVVSFTMMASVLTGKLLDPTDVAKYAGDRNMHVCGSGSSHELPMVLADEYGLEAKNIDGSSIDELNKYLRDGWMVWTCGSGSNPFTSGGHCIGIRGITSSGKWLLADSAGERGRVNSTETEWEPSSIYGQMNNFKAIRKK